MFRALQGQRGQTRQAQGLGMGRNPSAPPLFGVSGGQFGQLGRGQVSGPSLEEVLSQRGFKIPERPTGAEPSIALMYKDPLTGKMTSGGPHSASHANAMSKFYAKNPEALKIAKQHQKDQQYNPGGFGDLHQGPPKPPQEIMPQPFGAPELQERIPGSIPPPDKYGRKFSGQQYGKDVFRNTSESFKLMAKEAGFADMPVDFGGGMIDSRDMPGGIDPVTGKQWGGGSVGLNRRRKLANYFEKNPGAKEWWQSNFGEKTAPEGWGGPDQGLYKGGLGDSLVNDLNAVGTPITAPVPPTPIKTSGMDPTPLFKESPLVGDQTITPPPMEEPVFGGQTGGGIGGLQQFMQIMQMIIQMVQQSQGMGMGGMGMGMGGMRRNNFAQPQGFGSFNQYQSRQQYRPQFQQNFNNPYGPY